MTFVQICAKMTKKEHLFSFFNRRNKPMTANELEVINLIHNDENPEEAFKIALDLLFERLDELGAFQCKVVAPVQEAF